jgi:hypothetical protein
MEHGEYTVPTKIVIPRSASDEEPAVLFAREKKQIPRCARNDKSTLDWRRGRDPVVVESLRRIRSPHLVAIPRSFTPKLSFRGAQATRNLLFSSPARKSRFLAALGMTNQRWTGVAAATQ